jgi:hypothetical protein
MLCCDGQGAKIANAGIYCSVQFYNIKHGHNQHLQQRSRTLSDYSLFIELCRQRNRELHDWKSAVVETVRYCVVNGIEQGKREAAKAMLARGYEMGEVAEVTGLAKEAISKL